MSGDAPVRVLHVDDDEAFVSMAAEHLERESERLSVVTETDPGAALDRLDGVDCVVSDFEMPGMDGVELLRAVREEYPDLPFVLFTGRGSEAVASDAIEAGVSTYLQKGGPDTYAMLANRIEAHVGRYRAERRAAEQERVSRVVREINRRLVLADRREEIEQAVCEAIAESEPYLFAWVGDADDGGEVVPRAQAGVEFDLGELTVATDGEYGQGPVGRAFRRRELQVVQDYRELDLPEWRRVCEEHGVASLAVIPLVHDGTMYGILDVYAPRTGAFDADEQELLAELGDTIAAAIDSAENARDAEMFRALLDNVPAGIYIKNTDAEHVAVSDYHVRQLHEADLLAAEHGTDYLLGRTDVEAFDHDTARETHEDDLAVIESEEPVLGKTERVGSPDGEDVWVRTWKVPWDEDGERRGLVGVSRDVTREHRYRRELERQNERLEEFAAAVSHDLRNPLSIAQGNLDLLETDDEATRQRVAGALDRMEALIEDLLALARQGQAVGETEPVDLAALAGECWAAVETGGATVETEPVTVEADPDRVRQLLANLFRNAVEHGGDGVTVSVGPTDGGFYVADDGPGIPAGERDRVFERGYTTADEGTGFGLAIVEEIVEAHGWTIGVGESEAGGARFEIRTG
ncbi:MAG: ATP-binding protein [Halobacteriaceae archaeon]